MNVMVKRLFNEFQKKEAKALLDLASKSIKDWEAYAEARAKYFAIKELRIAAQSQIKEVDDED